VQTGLVRAFRSGDEGRIVELSNETLAPYAGWMPRTAEYWRWSVLNHPGLNPSDILVLECEGQIVGYAALLRDGHVLEFSVLASQRRRKRRALIQQLVEAVETNARAYGCDLLSFSLPAVDAVLDKALRASGYVVESGQCFSLGILDPRTLLEQLLATRRARLPVQAADSYIFELSPGNYPVLMASRLLVQLNPTVRVTDVSHAAASPADCAIRIDLCALTELIFCRISAADLLSGGQLTVAPATRVDQALELLGVLAIETPWHVPLSDGF
jgi:hypothetical protein